MYNHDRYKIVKSHKYKWYEITNTMPNYDVAVIFSHCLSHLNMSVADMLALSLCLFFHGNEKLWCGKWTFQSSFVFFLFSWLKRHITDKDCSFETPKTLQIRTHQLFWNIYLDQQTYRRRKLQFSWVIFTSCMHKHL